MFENTVPVSACPTAKISYCHDCDLFADLEGLHVTAVDRAARKATLIVWVESAKTLTGCPYCGVIAASAGRREVELIYAVPARLILRRRRWRCQDSDCSRGVFTEENPAVATPRALLTRRCIAWGIRQMRRENLPIQGLARQLGVDWHTVWKAIRPLLGAS